MLKFLYACLNKLNKDFEQRWRIFVGIDGLKSRSIWLEYDLDILGVDFAVEQLFISFLNKPKLLLLTFCPQKMHWKVS